ncbi:beta-1,6-N-acetylglucosaminyltransferase [uncultured Merdimonas sp.]|uniref:beta-1,6-N-acetylglucosaminyltransferase n=1 Tax=uncultured Merdimonas sp. TaxID=2023269 RepID=UPI0032079E61
MAYLLTCHKNPEQINMFIKQLLSYGDCDVYIHVDSKNKEIVKKIYSNERVHCYSKYDVRWGSVEIVLAGLYLMKKALESGIDYTHMYFGSGQDFLVKKGLYEHLEKTNKSVYIHINGKVKTRDRAAARYKIEWPRKLMIRNDFHIYRFVRIAFQMLHRIGIDIYPNKKILKNKVDFYDGHTWFIAKTEVIRYILDYVQKNPDYIKYWAKSLAADLMFFHTIIMNSPYKNDTAEELMYVNFGKTFGTMNHPSTVKVNDLKKIETGNWYCARKFELYESEASREAIIRCLEHTME